MPKVKTNNKTGYISGNDWAKLLRETEREASFSVIKQLMIDPRFRNRECGEAAFALIKTAEEIFEQFEEILAGTL